MHACRLFVIVSTVLMASAAGAEFQVNTQTIGDQASPAVAVDGSGGFVAVWTDGTNGVVARRYDADGAPVAAEFQVSPNPAVSQRNPVVAAAPTGEFVVAWDAGGIVPPDGSELAVFAQRFDALGVPAGTAFLVNAYTPSWQAHPAIAMDVAGNFVIVWESNQQDGDATGIFGQRYAASGAPLSGEFQINTHTAGVQGDNGLAVAMAPDGRFVVSWRSRAQDDGDPSASGGGVYAQRYAADGTTDGGEFAVNTTTAGSQGFAGVGAAMDGAGNLVLVWTSNHNFEPFLPGGEIVGQRYDSAGIPIGAEFQINDNSANSQFSAAVAADAAGNFLVTFRGDDGDRAGMFGRYFASDGTPSTKEFRINLERGGEQHGRAVAANAAGRFAVVWDSECRSFSTQCEQSQDGDGLGVFGQRYNTVTPTCAALPAVDCQDAGSSKLMLRAVGQGRLLWSWEEGPGFDVTQFGNPAAGLTGYALCIYREDGGAPSLIADASIPAGGTCGTRPCWRVPGTLRKAVYRDGNTGDGTADGITSIDLRAGDAGSARLKVKGAGPDLDAPLPVGSFTKITTQLINGIGACWQSEHVSPAQANDASRFTVLK